MSDPKPGGRITLRNPTEHINVSEFYDFNIRGDHWLEYRAESGSDHLVPPWRVVDIEVWG